MKTKSIALTIMTLLLTASAGLAMAASPPQLLNYQGVLRDTNGNPLSGDHDMVFRLVEAGSGNNILIDEHLGGAAGSGVSVVNGLFTVQIGSGNVLDGGGAGSYTSLADVFRDFDDVLLSIEVNGELLTPAIPIASTPFALNATHFDGLDQGQFLRTDVPASASGNIWFSASPAGGTINDASVLIKPVAANPDETLLGVAVSLSEKFRVDAEGDTFIGGLLNMPNGAQFWDNGFGLQIYGGDTDTDDIFLRAGNSSDDGALTIVGDGIMELKAGNDFFSFKAGSTASEVLNIEPYRLTFSPPANFVSTISGGALSTNRLELVPYTGASSHKIDLGDSQIEFSGSEFAFSNLTGSANIKGFINLSIGAFKDLVFWIDNESTHTDAEAQWWTMDEIFFPSPATVPIQLAELQEDGDFRILGTYENSVSFDVAESFLAAEPVEAGDLVSVSSSRGDAVRLAAGANDTAVIGVVSTNPGLLFGGVPFDATTLREVWGERVHEEYLDNRDALLQRALAEHPHFQTDLENDGRGPGATGAHAPGTPSGYASSSRTSPDERFRLEHSAEGLALELFCRERLAPVALAGRVPVKVDAGYGSIRVGDLLTTSPTPGHAMRADDPMPGTVIGKALESLDSGTGKVMVLVMLR